MQPRVQDESERSPMSERYGEATLTRRNQRVFVARHGHDDETEQARRAALIDLSNLPRVGFRGAQAAGYLQGRGYALPQAPNRAVRQPSGEQILRLSQTEYLLLGALADGGARIAEEETASQPGEKGCYLLPRQDSHAWLALTGAHLPEVMAKVCGVDLRPGALATDAVVQTSVARVNAILFDGSTANLPIFHLLCDRASAHYLWGALLDALGEFGGKPAGILALDANP